MSDRDRQPAPGSLGAYWARNLASGGIRWHDLSQPVTGPFRHHARSEDDSQGYGMAPPAGFEPALTAPEAVALSPELWGLRAVESVPVTAPFPDTRLLQELEVDVEGAVGLGGAAIAGGQGDPVFGCRGGDEGVVDSAPRDAKRCQPGMESFRPLRAEEA